MPLDRALQTLHAREAELARVQRIGQIGGLEVDLRGGAFRNRRSPEYLLVHGLPPASAEETHEAWVARIHPDDRDRVVEHFCASVAGSSLDYEVEYRIIRPSDGAMRWIMAKAEIERDDAGAPIRLVGAHIDITARRQAEEQRQLIARELSHRIANIFAVVTSLIKMSSRSHPEASDFADGLIGRVNALHQAHGFVMPAKPTAEGTTLQALFDRLLAPYRSPDAARIRIVGDDAEIGPSAATAIALTLHELATNAMKYGALSGPDGHVDILIAREPDCVEVTWTERGGPEVAIPTRKGFGSVLVERALRSQLGADFQFDWHATGLEVRLTLQRGRLGQ